jgi:hypothetical protein
MEQSLALSAPTRKIVPLTVSLYLRDMSADSSPTTDLSLIVGTTSSTEIAAIPLEPSARILVIHPAVRSPNRERLRSVDPEVIQLRIMPEGA